VSDTSRDSAAAQFWRGRTTVFACQVDQRFSYCLYVPGETGPGPAPLVVVQHGTERNFLLYRDHLQEFAEQWRAVVLAPLFPAGIEDPDDVHNFKFLKYRGIRFDEVLLAMVDEVAARYPVDGSRFYLHGFSGGGQFVHRFLYLHASRLAAASIGAPGRVTLIDDDQRWWLGTADLADVFGQPLDIEALRQVPVLMVVGDRDTDTAEINNAGDSNWLEGVERTGRTRIERLRALERNYRAHGIDVRFVLVPGVAHRGSLVLPAVQEFFAGLIQTSRST
jgi:poly(3-hydroxybutyrate) depolymerase